MMFGIRARNNEKEKKERRSEKKCIDESNMVTKRNAVTLRDQSLFFVSMYVGYTRSV